MTVRALVLVFSLASIPATAFGQPTEGWELTAVEYAHSQSVQTRRLVRGAGASERTPMSWYFFVARKGDRVVLIDCGTDAFSRPGRGALRERWGVVRSRTVSAALSALSISLGEVTDVVITHHHWDHVGSLDQFPAPVVHVQRGEWRRIPLRLRRQAMREARVRVISNQSREVLPGLSVMVNGAHTQFHSMVEVRCSDRTVVLASDAAYLFRNIETGAPSAVSVDRAQTQRDVRAAVERVGAENVLPGHDSELFERFPSLAPGTAQVCSTTRP